MEFEKKSFLDLPGLKTYDSKIKDHIDKKIVQSDWEQNDTAAVDYIKNRTHWTDSETETTVYYDNLTFDLIVDNNTAPEIIDENVKGIDTSKEVTVIWDNKEYNLIPTKPESANVYGIGNWGLVDPNLYEYTTVPFLIQLQEGLPYHMWLNPTTTEHTISMYQSEEKEVFHELDENFIPDTIQRVADNIGKPGAGSNSEIFNDYTGNTAEGSYSHAEGYSTDAIGNFSHAENYCTTAEGYGAHAEGSFTKANGEYSHAEGNGTVAQGPNSHAEGNNTTAFGENSHAEGNSTNNALTVIPDLSEETDNNTIVTTWKSQKFLLAKGDYSHAEGKDNLALGKNSHAEGSLTQALSEEAHSEGNQTIANGWFSHAEGSKTIASGNASHAEGMKSEASGRYSHAEGAGTIVSGAYSHAEGNNTIAASNNQHVQGKNNISDADEEGNALNTYAHIVGNGLSPMKRSNAHTLDWDGNGWYAGNLYVGGTSQADATRVATVADITNNFYPIGAIYLSTTETSPASLFGGTWEQIKDTFLLAAGDTYTAGTTGGSATVTLTEAQMPEHQHTTISPAVYNATGEGTTKGYQWNDTGADNWGIQYVDIAGQSQPHENMPPYLAVYVWKRIE